MSAVSWMRTCSSAGLWWLWTFLAIAGLSCDNDNTELIEDPYILPEFETMDGAPAWSSTSDWIAFQRQGEETANLSAILLIRPDGSEPERTVDLGYDPDWV